MLLFSLSKMTSHPNFLCIVSTYMLRDYIYGGLLLGGIEVILSFMYYLLRKEQKFSKWLSQTILHFFRTVLVWPIVVWQVIKAIATPV